MFCAPCVHLLFSFLKPCWKGGLLIDLAKSAEDFCRFLWRSYLVERRYDILGDVVDPGISVIGTGAHEISRNLQEFSASMERESAEWNGVFTIRDQWYQTTCVADDIYLVMGELMAKEDSTDGILYDVRFRFTLLLRRCEGSWKVLHVHQSVPDPNQAQDEFFPHRMVEQNGQQVIYNLRHDTMTGLLNRLYLTDTVNRYMADQPAGLLLTLDVDKFKTLNDNYGHPFGDKVLIALAQSLKSCFPAAALGRIGGDEFVVYLPGEVNHDSLAAAVCAFQQDWQESQRAARFPQPITVSMGAARFPQHGSTYRAVWEKADEALYQAKSRGGDQLCLLPGE